MRRRIAAAAVIAVGLVLALAGCTFFTPQATLIHYDPSDGVGVTVGAVDVRNAFVVSSDGVDGNFVGAVINNDETSKIVNIQYVSHSSGTAKNVTEHITLTGNETMSYGNPGVARFQLYGIDSKPGTLLKLIVSYAGHTGKSVLVPVLDGPLKAYTHLYPTPTPSASSTCSITKAGQIVGCGTATPTPTSTAVTH